MNSLNIKDHAVSKEIFKLQTHQKFEILITTPQPSKQELSKYYKDPTYISHTDSKQTLFEKTYQFVRKYTLLTKKNKVNRFSKKGNLLDIGCGTGNFLKKMQSNGWTVTGIEPNNTARAIANSKTNNTVFKTEKLTTLQPTSFNVITLWHVLEHLPDLEAHIQLFKKLLKPNGILIIAVPNYKSYDAQYYKEFWAAYDVPRHLWHFSKNGIKSIFKKYNMLVQKIYPMKFDAFYVSLLSEQHKTGCKNIINAFYRGLLSNIKAIKTNEYSSLIYIIKKDNL